MKKINLAIVSPLQNAYSETFIKAHKELIDANVLYYSGGTIPTHLEGLGNINPSYFLLKKIVNRLIGRKMTDPRWAIKEALKDSFKKEKIKVVLAEYGPVANDILSICKSLNLPMIVHFHGYDASVSEVLKANDNYKEVFEYASSIVVVSKVMHHNLLSLSCPEDKLLLNPYGPNDAFQKLTPSMEEETLIGIGRFTDKKAPYYTILAFKEVVKKIPNAKLKLAGDGILFNTCKNLIKLYGLDSNIELIGVITPKEFQNELLKARAFVQHSITASNGDMEGTPLAVLESSSAGIPVISTIHAGIPDVIIHGETGLLVNEHDVEGMANQMIELLNDKSLAIKMGNAGKIYIKENFSMKKHIDVLDGLVKKASEIF